MEIAEQLLRYANARERALERTPYYNMARREAISKIRAVASYFKGRPAHQQLSAVKQTHHQILEVLPSSESRFSRLREKMLKLIHQSKYHYANLEQSKST